MLVEPNILKFSNSFARNSMKIVLFTKTCFIGVDEFQVFCSIDSHSVVLRPARSISPRPCQKYICRPSSKNARYKTQPSVLLQVLLVLLMHTKFANHQKGERSLLLLSRQDYKFHSCLTPFIQCLQSSSKQQNSTHLLPCRH